MGLKLIKIFLLFYFVINFNINPSPYQIFYPKDIDKDWNDENYLWIEIDSSEWYKPHGGYQKLKLDDSATLSIGEFSFKNLPKNFYYFFYDYHEKYYLLIFDQNKQMILYLDYGDFDINNFHAGTDVNKGLVRRYLQKNNILTNKNKQNSNLLLNYSYTTKHYTACDVYLVPWLEKWFKKNFTIK